MLDDSAIEPRATFAGSGVRVAFGSALPMVSDLRYGEYFARVVHRWLYKWANITHHAIGQAIRVA